jgi:hypothetical protein
MAAVALGFSVIGGLLALRTAVVARQIEQWVINNNKKSIGLKQLTQLETEMTEHADSIASLHASLKKLRSRVGMRNLRENGLDSASMPDSLRDPAGYKRAMRLKLFKQGNKNGDS